MASRVGLHCLGSKSKKLEVMNSLTIKVCGCYQLFFMFFDFYQLDVYNDLYVAFSKCTMKASSKFGLGIPYLIKVIGSACRLIL